MSDLMLFAVLRMPYDLAMSDELSRRQFYARAQQAADELQAFKDADAITNPDWLPIATAPKDGTRIRGWDAAGYVLDGIKWDHQHWLNGKPYGPKSWGGESMDGPGHNPTHWTPMPPKIAGPKMGGAA